MTPGTPMPTPDHCTHPNCETHGKSPCQGIGCDGRTDDERATATTTTTTTHEWVTAHRNKRATAAHATTVRALVREIRTEAQTITHALAADPPLRPRMAHRPVRHPRHPYRHAPGPPQPVPRPQNVRHRQDPPMTPRPPLIPATDPTRTPPAPTPDPNPNPYRHMVTAHPGNTVADLDTHAAALAHEHPNETHLALLDRIHTAWHAGTPEPTHAADDYGTHPTYTGAPRPPRRPLVRPDHLVPTWRPVRDPAVAATDTEAAPLSTVHTATPAADPPTTPTAPSTTATPRRRGTPNRR